MKSDAIIEVVRSAFPAGEPLVAPIVKCACPECDDIAVDFVGRTWPNMPSELMIEHYTALPLFTATAFKIVLPAYLIHALTFPEWAVGEHLMYQLARRHDYSDEVHFTGAQAESIVHFAEWYAQREEYFEEELRDIRLHWTPG